MTEEQKFHVSRRMFCILDNAVHVAVRGRTDSHVEWMMAEHLIDSVDDPRFRECVRGFERSGNLYAYRGPDMEAHGVLSVVRHHLNDLMVMLNLPLEARFFAGMKRGTVGKTWEPLHDFGLVRAFQ